MAIELRDHASMLMAQLTGRVEHELMSPGRLITIEGIDGAGKSTLAAALSDELRRREIEVQLLREPGGVVAAERIRELVKDPALRIGRAGGGAAVRGGPGAVGRGGAHSDARAREWVLLDRFVDSSLAYQGAGRGLGVDAVAAINQFATGGLRAGPHSAARSRPDRRPVAPRDRAARRGARPPGKRTG